MDRAQRRVISPQFGAPGSFDPRRTPSSADYDDFDHIHPQHLPHHHHHPPPPHHHSFNDSNNSVSPFDPPNQSEPVPFQTEPHHYSNTYTVGYRDQHLPSSYRATTSRETLPHHPPAPISATYKILCITNINPKISDAHVKDALISDFSRFGDISVSICHDSGERLVYLYFRTYDEAREARHAKARSILFDRPIEIEPIYEPRLSPGESPPPQAYPMRRRSITPPDYYNGMHQPPSRRAPVPPSSFTQNPHHRPASPHNYLYSSRYPPGPAPSMMSNSTVYSRYNPHDSHFPPQPASPYNSPPAEPSRMYQPDPSSHQYSPGGNPSHQPPMYGYMPNRERERERSIPESYGPRSPRSEHFYDNREWTNQIPHSSRGPPPSHIFPRPNSPTNTHYRPGALPVRRSPPSIYPESSRYPGREFKRARVASHIPDRDDSKPSRVIFITNLDSSYVESQLRSTFEVFGNIEELEAKKITPDMVSALIMFTSMDCAYRAKTAMNGKYIGNSKCRICYGKVSASRRLWLGGLGANTTLSSLDEEFGKFGEIVCLDYVSGRPYGYVEYKTANQAQFAVMHLKGSLVAGADKRLRIEYVDSDKSAKPDQGYPNSETNSRYRSEDVWSKDERTSNESAERKRNLSPSEVNVKKVPLPPGEPEDRCDDLRDRSDIFHRTDTPSSSPNYNKQPGQNHTERNNNNRESVCNDYHSRSKEDLNNIAYPRPTDIRQTRTIDEMVVSCQTSWICQLVLRNFTFPSRMFMCSGDKVTVEKYILKQDSRDEASCPVLEITQRWRLYPQPKLEEVKKRMLSGNLGVFLFKQRLDHSPSDSPSAPQCSVSQATQLNGEKEASTDDRSESSGSPVTQVRPLKNLISYLEQKDAAGVVPLTNPDCGQSGEPKLLYTFPPGEFAITLIRSVAPHQIDEGSSKNDFLLGVLVSTADTKV